MRWTIAHLAPDRTPKAEYDNLSPGGWLDPWEWTALPNGDGVRGSLNAHHPSMSAAVGPRDILILSLELTPGEAPVAVFSGAVVEVKPDRFADEDTVELIGLRDALKRVLLDARALTGDTQAVIAGLASLLPPSVLYDAARIGTTGSIVGTSAQPFFMPTSSLADALDTLAAAEPGYSWGVDATGTLFYAMAGGGHTVDYVGSGFRWETVTADGLITRATVLIAGSISPPGATVQVDVGDSGLPGPYLPIPVTASAEDPQHNLYRAEAVDLPPPGVEPIAGVTPSAVGFPVASSSPQWLDVANAHDGNEATSAQSLVTGIVGGSRGISYTLPETPEARALAHDVIGIEVVYSLATGKVGVLSFSRTTFGPGTYARTGTSYQLDPATNGRVRLLVPRTAQQANDTLFQLVLGVSLTDAQQDFEMRVHEVRAILPNTVPMQEVARSRLNPPAQEPAGVTLEGYFAPAVALNVTGTPGGDVVGSVGQIDYAYSAEDGITTRISLGLPPGEKVQRLIRLAAKDLDASDRDRQRHYIDRKGR